MTDTPVTLPPRSTIPKEHTFNAESMFPDKAAWEQELNNIAADAKTMDAYRGRLVEGPAVVADALEAFYALYNRIGKVLVYAGMYASTDTTDQAAQAMDDRATSVFAEVAAAGSFIDPELIAIGRDRLTQWVKEAPRLASYAHYLDNLFRLQAHVRSADVEGVLSSVMSVFASIDSTYSALSNADLTFEPAVSSTGEVIPIGQSNRVALFDKVDREIRRTTFEHYHDAYYAFRNTFAAALTGAVKRDVFRARARRYPSALEAALAPNNIPVAVFHNLINVFRQNLPIWHRYWAVRRRALGVNRLHYYDLWAPLKNNPIKVPYEQGVDWICAGMQPLGDEYVATLRRGCLEDRWVDRYPNHGKRQGAFSSGWQGTLPFIMTGYTDDMQSMSVLAHELGHSMHSYFTWQNQPPAYSDYSLFVAEVASNFNQAMVRAHLLATNNDPNFQLAVIEEAMTNFLRYFFIMPTLARFELEFHERVERGEAPSADDLCALMADLFEEGFGGEVENQRSQIGIIWATFGHLYANFYVFQYATGISAAHALSRRVLSGAPGAADAYLGFLKAGSSDYALNVLRKAGVDLTTPEPVEATFAVLRDYVDRLEALV
ncbi:MAG: oligoendopeptidase F [Anaerolineae bacterium]|nr:oligoendopeptidase F [Anaerolineae bacterium]